jgi:Adenylate and Guanylate cyclase catalytic domain
VNSGRTYVGNVGGHGVVDFTALGDSVNTAARLASAAGAGELLLSESVYAAMTEQFPNLEQRTLTLRGKEAPFAVPVCALAHPGYRRAFNARSGSGAAKVPRPRRPLRCPLSAPDAGQTSAEYRTPGASQNACSVMREASASRFAEESRTIAHDPLQCATSSMHRSSSTPLPMPVALRHRAEFYRTLQR